METLDAILVLLGNVLRVVGALVFGVGVGWLTVRVFLRDDQRWELATAAYLGLLAAFVLVGRWVAGGGTLGAFGLGAGLGVLIWGVVVVRRAGQDGDQK